jgi:hypothetical protein
LKRERKEEAKKTKASGAGILHQHSWLPGGRRRSKNLSHAPMMLLCEAFRVSVERFVRNARPQSLTPIPKARLRGRKMSSDTDN